MERRLCSVERLPDDEAISILELAPVSADVVAEELEEEAAAHR